MASRVVMPKLTDTMEEGLIIRWYKQEGDPVESGDALAEIETDKSVMDLEAYASGIMRKLLVPAETKVPAGALIAVIGREDEDISNILEEVVPAEKNKVGPSKSGASTQSKIGSKTGESNLKKGAMSPRARKMASDSGIRPDEIEGSGPGGLITERDVKTALLRRESPDSDFSTVELSLMRSVIAKRMTQSKQTAPHFYVTIDINMDQALQLKGRLSKEKTKVSVTDILIRAVALSLKKFPQINASYAGNNIRYYNKIHIGLAVGLDDGIMTPIIRDADQKSLSQIAETSQELVERAKTRRLAPEEYTGSTFSLSNLGMFEVDHFIAIVQPGEGAVLAVGSVRDVPAITEGQLKIEKRMKVTLSCDHRAIDGLQAARFLQHFKHRMEEGDLE